MATLTVASVFEIVAAGLPAMPAAKSNKVKRGGVVPLATFEICFKSTLPKSIRRDFSPWTKKVTVSPILQAPVETPSFRSNKVM